MENAPHSLEAEQSVLGAILISPEKYEDIADMLSPDDFYLENHKNIYDCMMNLYLEKSSIDLIALLENMLSKGSQGDDRARSVAKEYLMKLSDIVPVSDNIKEYAGIVKEKSLRRKLLNVSEEIADMVHNDASDITKIIDRAEHMVFSVTDGSAKQDFLHVRNILVDVLEDIHQCAINKGSTQGISSGFSKIDNMLMGMNPGDLILIGARPSVGKTTFAMNIAVNAAAKNKAIAVFSLEMSRQQIVSRLLVSESSVERYKMKTGMLNDDDWVKITEACSRISECDIFIDDTSSMSVTSMRTKLRRLKKFDMIIIDYLQLMYADRDYKGNKVLEVTEISKGLKIMAKEFGVPVIACSQLNRSIESTQRKDKRPLLSDLRDSGSIEQDADVVMFLHRDDYQNESLENHDRAEIIIAKNRHGETGTVKVGFKKKYTRFYDFDMVHTE